MQHKYCYIYKEAVLKISFHLLNFSVLSIRPVMLRDEIKSGFSSSFWIQS